MVSPFLERHLGPGNAEQRSMLKTLGYSDMAAFIADVVPSDILDEHPPLEAMPKGCSESEALEDLRRIVADNTVRRSLIGLGYHGTATPALIQRHVFENPAWYTAYTPYQAEIAQGRLEALLNFQTLISELTGLPIANASLLDEATAAAEAMGLSHAVCRRAEARRFLVDAAVLPQTWAVLQTRAEPLNIELERLDPG
ncbi:MAG: glycine dehydrogenase (aminomethyl-transferring), partial [Planctomycetaceae bacterium TMED241]